MSRIFSRPGEEAPVIDPDAVLGFFEQRAVKAGALGPTRAVIYQDKHADLAEQRDAAEKALLLPKMQVSAEDRIVDVGCGTGRWAQALLPLGAYYHGCDLSPGLIEIAREQYKSFDNARFSTLSGSGVTLEALSETDPFNRILVVGIFLYMNDDDAARSMHAISALAAPKCRFILREPIALENRLTIKEHYSDDMDQTYNATYRTQDQLFELIDASFGKAGFSLEDSGDVYADANLNNRAETRQRWFVFER